MITINADITTGSGNLTLSVQEAALASCWPAPVIRRSLSGAAVSLTGVINVGSHNLMVTATGQLTLNSNINGGTRILTLIAGTSGTGDIVNGSDMRQLTAGTVSLTQASAFAEDALFTFGGRATPSLILRVHRP